MFRVMTMDEIVEAVERWAPGKKLGVFDRKTLEMILRHERAQIVRADNHVEYARAQDAQEIPAAAWRT